LARGGARAARRLGQRQSVPRSLRGRTMAATAVTATATRLMVMVMTPGTTLTGLLLPLLVAPGTATVTALAGLLAMTPATALRLMVLTDLPTSMLLLPVSIIIITNAGRVRALGEPGRPISCRAVQRVHFCSVDTGL
jgi:hypothetical protein